MGSSFKEVIVYKRKNASLLVSITSTMHRGRHPNNWDEDDREISGFGGDLVEGEEEEPPSVFNRAMTDHKDKRRGFYSRKQQPVADVGSDSWTCLDQDPDASLPSPLKPEIYTPERKSRSYHIALPEYRSVRKNEREVEYLSELVREFGGSDEESYEYIPDYKQPGAATEVMFEDVIPDYVTAEDEAVAYPLPYFTTPRSNSRPRKPRAEESRELYDELRHLGHGRSRDISFGEGLPGQNMSYKGKGATVILPPPTRMMKKEVSLCRDRGCNLVADPDANGFCLAHFKELQADLYYQPRGSAYRTPSREIPKQKGHSESPRRASASVERGSASAAIKVDCQAAQKR